MASLPWLLFLGLFLPVALAVPLLLEHKRVRDEGPRQIPVTTLDLQKRQARSTRRSVRRISDPKVMPGLTHLSTNLEIIAETEIGGNVVTQGSLTVGVGGSLKGSAKAKKGIHLLAKAQVFGNLISGGAVDLDRLSYVQGIVYSVGDVTLKPGAVVKGIYTDGKVNVYPGAEIVEDVIAREGVHLVVPTDDSRALADLESLNALISPEEFAEGDE